MHRREPPPQATWILEHLTTGTRNEALAGDLLEELRSGRSNRWYWRQVISACAVSWSKSLALRGPMLAFVLLWSALAPAWQVIVERIEAAPIFASLWQVLGPLWLPFALAGWTALHAAFLWAGVLAYLLANTILGRTIRRREANRAFVLTALVFPPVAGLTFILANLYWYSVPGLAQAKLAATSMGQIADLGALADLIRIPYLIAHVSALWTLIPQPTRRIHQPSDFFAERFSADSGMAALELSVDPTSLRRFFTFMVAAGFINAMIAGFLLCRLPDAHSPTLSSLLWRAMAYVAIGAAAGVMGAYLYWQNPSSPFREKPPVPFPLFALACVSGWVWVPAMVIFSEALSAGAALVAMIGAFLLAAGLRRATYFVLSPAASGVAHGDSELFEEALYRAPADLIGYAIALCLYAALIALASRWNMSAAALLALAATLFGWKKTIPLGHALHAKYEVSRATVRAGLVAVPAILITAWALLEGVAHRNHMQAAPASTAFSFTAPKDTDEKPTPQKGAYGVGGYESVILWPYREKKQIVPPPLHQESLLAPGTTRPLVLRFTGAYWYLQPPEQLPGPKAHQAFGSPLKVNIASNDDIPLVMDAHQTLSSEIATARCREVAVDIENFENKEGSIALALLLSDGVSSPHQTLYLGQQPIVSTLHDHFWFKAAPVSETLSFAVPAKASLRQFNEITVLILPDSDHMLAAPRISVEQFQLFPR